jgi:glyoxylate reductase
LTEVAEIITPKATNREEFIAECKSGRFDDVVAAYRTFPSVSITGIFDEELVQAIPKNWRFLAHNGAGYDQLDAHACAARDPPLLVSNIPTIADDSTADTAVFLILGALRNLNPSMQALRQGQWKGSPPPALGHDPQGKTLGILGMGGIGRNLKVKMDVFGMKAIYHNRRKMSGEDAAGAEYVSFDELLARSDVLSLNLPLNVSLRPIGNGQNTELISVLAQDTSHHLNRRVRKDEEGSGYCEHRSRTSHGRRRTGKSLGLWPCGFLRS